MSKKFEKSKSKKTGGALPFKKALAFVGAHKIAFGAGALFLVAAAAGSGFAFRQFRKAKNQTVRVGFYNLPEKVTTSIEETIKNSDSVATGFKTISPEEISSGKYLKSYDLIFTFDGLEADTLKKEAANISGNIYNFLPTSVRRENETDFRKSVPLLFDHFEFSYNKNVAQKIGAENPKTYEELLDFLEFSKKYTFSPFFTNGGDDEILLSLITTFIEGLGGYSAYEDFVRTVKKQPSFEKICAQKLGNSEITLLDILDILRSWQESGIVHPNWYNAKFRDCIAFMSDGQVAVFFTKLSVHRTIPYKVIKDFSTGRFPVSLKAGDHAVIAPAVCAVKISKKSASDRILTRLLDEEGQTRLSLQTQLAPVALRGESYDIQADDVRFFAASCRYGNRPGIYSAAFSADSAQAQKLCESIRNYLSKGKI